MTLHQTIDVAKKFFLGAAMGVGGIIVLVLLFQLGVIIKNTLYPPEMQPPTHLYDVLPKITFPQNVTSNKFIYTLNTVTGTLPEFPDRLNVFLIQKAQPNFLNLDKARQKAAKLGITTNQGSVSAERNLGNGSYQWTQNENLNKKLTMNILSFDFSLTSNYLYSPLVLEAKKLGNEENAINKAKQFLEEIGLTSEDIEIEKATTQLFAITNGVLTPTTSLSRAQVIRVDLYQKNMAYALNTGIPEVSGGTKKLDLDLPILYPNPPFSTMTFWVAQGSGDPEVVAADFVHKAIEIDEKNEATYPIKTAQAAFDELKEGKGYIASFTGSTADVAITDVYLAYYMSEDPQEYLMPVIVFEGDNGFIAYISAVSEEWIKQ